MKLKYWLETPDYLPKFLKDWHDQKMFFRMFHHKIGKAMEEGDINLNWVKTHIFVVDFFLHFMARRGYTLQKTRTRKVEDFLDLDAEIAEFDKMESEAHDKMLKGYLDWSKKEREKVAAAVANNFTITKD